MKEKPMPKLAEKQHSTSVDDYHEQRKRLEFARLYDHLIVSTDEIVSHLEKVMKQAERDQVAIGYIEVIEADYPNCKLLCGCSNLEERIKRAFCKRIAMSEELASVSFSDSPTDASGLTIRVTFQPPFMIGSL